MESRNDLDLAFFRRRLSEEKELAEQVIAGTKASHNDGTDTMGMEQNETSLGADDNHPADLGTDLQLREQDDALIANAQEILAKVEEALLRMDEGKYGLSVRSGEPIMRERLEAVPYATLTMEEQTADESDMASPLGGLI